MSLLWTDGDRHVPCDYRIYHDAKHATKNDHFRAMIRAATSGGPGLVIGIRKGVFRRLDTAGKSTTLPPVGSSSG